MTELERRYGEAIERIGGTFALLALPEKVRKALSVNAELAVKVRMLEAVAEAVEREK